MDFGSLPPEVNSARMYSGAGSTPLVTAASAWSRLAGELNSAARGYDSVITRLASEEWLGPASTAMSESAIPYVTWMNSTAAQAEQAATQAREVAAAYEAAFAATVPPAQVTANRSRLRSLNATNVLGQNTPAIAMNEAQYGEMWAQDAAAMYGYAGHSAVASKVTPFSSPQQTTNPAGEAGQAAAVAKAIGTSSESKTTDLMSSVQNSLHKLASPAASSSEASTGSGGVLGALQSNAQGAAEDPIGSILDPWATYIGPTQSSIAIPHFILGAMNSFTSLAKSWGPAAAKAAGDGAAAAAGLPAVGAVGGLLGGGGAPVAAGLGNAVSVGRLSAPAAWVATGPASFPGSPVPISSVAAAAPEVEGAGNLMGGMPLAGAGAGGGGTGPKYGFRPTIMARPPSAG